MADNQDWSYTPYVKPTTQPEVTERKITIRTCPFYFETLNQHRELLDKVEDFIDTKEENPVAPYGNHDSKMNSDGPLGKLRLWHARLDGDVRIFYRIKGKPATLYLCAVLNHKSSGTGNPPKLATQHSVATKIAHQIPELTESDEVEDAAGLITD